MDTATYDEFATDYYLTRKAMEWFWDAYIQDIERRKEIYASLNQADVEQLVGLPTDAAAGGRGEGGLVSDHHRDGPGRDVADPLAGVGVPAGLDPGRNLGEHLHDLPSRDGGRAMLDLGALEPAGERRRAVRRLSAGWQVCKGSPFLC
jgi:hypothetical protein